VQFVLEVGSFAILSLLISLLSEAEMAAHQIAIQVIHFSFLPCGRWARRRPCWRAGGGRERGRHGDARGAAGGGADGRLRGACAVVLAAASGFIVLGFTRDASVISVATRLLHVAAVFQIFDAANIVSRGVLRGAGTCATRRWWAW
jgi:MATE family multidrug resistance protein